MTLTPGTHLGRYEIRTKIGEGGMGEVYLAEDAQLRRRVALKILPSQLAANQDRMRRFIQEAQSAAALNHPNIAHIYEIGESEGTNFIAMEFVDGETLRKKIYREQTELKILLKHLLQVAEGLVKAHGSGIVHRDLKPDNIMITSDGHAKILDFGLVKLLETKPANEAEIAEAATKPAQHSTPGVVMGTVGYMSPEQAQAKPVDQRSDIFSFGCLLYETATGRMPFASNSVIDTLHKIIHEPAPAITDFNPSASPELQRVIRKCLAKEPDKRYQTIRDTANDLEELIEEMKGVSDSERSVAPPTTPITSTPSSTADERLAESTVSMSRPAASSAEYIVSGFKQHKIVTVIALLLLVAGAVGLRLYLRARPTHVAIESIAVMPFVNESGNADVEYLSDGMTETLISSLSNLPNLSVKPRSSVFHYKGKETNPLTIAKELNVQAILNGRVVQRGDQLTLSLELVDAQKDVVLWAEQYNRKQGDLVSLQSEIARDVSSKLKSRLSGTEVAKVEKNYTANPEAYRSYLQGRFYWNKRSAENLTKAIELFKAAVDKDPNYALAYVGLADCYVLMPEYIGRPPSEVLPEAKAYGLRALEIDASLAEAHASLGVINWLSFNYSEAEREYKRSIELNPNYATAHQWYARFLLRVKRLDEALAEIKRANELDPLSVVINRDVARVYRDRGELDSALEQIRKTIELEPNFQSSYNELAWVYLKQGRNAEALAAAEKAVELSNRLHGSLFTLGLIYIKLGKLAEVKAIVNELEEKYAKREAGAWAIAWLYAGLGEREKVFPWLEKFLKDNNGNLDRVEEAPEFEFLRGNARFKDLLRRLRLPD